MIFFHRVCSTCLISSTSASWSSLWTVDLRLICLTCPAYYAICKSLVANQANQAKYKKFVLRWRIRMQKGPLRFWNDRLNRTTVYLRSDDWLRFLYSSFLISIQILLVVFCNYKFKSDHYTTHVTMQCMCVPHIRLAVFGMNHTHLLAIRNWVHEMCSTRWQRWQ